MKNTFGNALKVTLFGESHGDSIGAVIDGLTPGIKIDYDFIDRQLERRKSKSSICTKRAEKDEYEIISGVFEGHTTGTPICIVIKNRDTRSSDYQVFSSVARPGHADYTANCKYHGYQDFRGGGHFSGRITVALVAAGAIIQSALEQKGIFIGTHIKRLACVDDRAFENYIDDIISLHSAEFSVLDENAKFEVLYNEYTRYDRTNSATNSYKAGSENDYSVCTLFSFGEKKFIFTGDLESGENHEGGEEKLVKNNQSLIDLRDNGNHYGVSLYKAGHHGSKTSSGETLLDAIRPEYVGVCCCAGSGEYKAEPENTFPTQAFIDRIAKYTDKIFVTTLCVDWQKGIYTSFNGNIVIWIKSQMENVSVDCSNNNKKLKDTEWFATNRINPWITE